MQGLPIAHCMRSPCCCRRSACTLQLPAQHAAPGVHPHAALLPTAEAAAAAAAAAGVAMPGMAPPPPGSVSLKHTGAPPPFSSVIGTDPWHCSTSISSTSISSTSSRGGFVTGSPCCCAACILAHPAPALVTRMSLLPCVACCTCLLVCCCMFAVQMAHLDAFFPGGPSSSAAAGRQAAADMVAEFEQAQVGGGPHLQAHYPPGHCWQQQQTVAGALLCDGCWQQQTAASRQDLTLQST